MQLFIPISTCKLSLKSLQLFYILNLDVIKVNCYNIFFFCFLYLNCPLRLVIVVLLLLICITVLCQFSLLTRSL